MKLLAIFSRVPYPLDKGDKLRAYHQLVHLSQEFDVKIICLSDTRVPQEHREHLQAQFNIEIIELSKPLIYWNLLKGLFSSKPYQVSYFHQYGAHRKVNKILEDFEPDYIYSQLIRVYEYFHVFRFGEHRHGDGGGMYSPLGFRNRNSLHTMDSALIF